MRGCVELFIDLASGDLPSRAEKSLLANRFGQVKQRRLFATFDPDRRLAARQGVRVHCRDHDDRLADVQHLILRQEWLVSDDQAKDVVTLDVAGGVAADHARDGQGRRAVDGFDGTVGDRAADKADMQLAFHLTPVVEKQRLPGDVTGGGIVGQRFARQKAWQAGRLRYFGAY